jgi:hypothetical protein
MAIDKPVAARTDHLLLYDFRIYMQEQVVTVTLLDQARGEVLTFNTQPAQWQAALAYLFDNLTNAAELKDRVEQYLLDQGLVSGTKVAD